MNQSGLVVAPGSRRVDSGAHEGIPVGHAFLSLDLVKPVGKESLHIDAAAVVICPANATCPLVSNGVTRPTVWFGQSDTCAPIAHSGEAALPVIPDTISRVLQREGV